MSGQNEDFHRFRDWASARAGVFRRQDCLDAGLTGHAFRRGIARREWHRYRGVWILDGYPDDIRARTWAALMRAGPESTVTGPTALWFYGLSSPDQRIFLRAPLGQHLRIPGVVVFRPSHDPVRPGEVHGIRVVARDEAVIDCVRLLSGQESRPIVLEAFRRGWITAGMLGAWSQRLRGCKGAGQLAIMAAQAARNVHAESEHLAARVLEEAAIGGWRANQPIHDQRGLIGIGDIVFEQQMLVIEIDGFAWHSDRARFQQDRSRQNRLTNAGWRVLRFTWRDITERPEDLVRTVRLALAMSA